MHLLHLANWFWKTAFVWRSYYPSYGKLEEASCSRPQPAKINFLTNSQPVVDWKMISEVCNRWARQQINKFGNRSCNKLTRSELPPRMKKLRNRALNSFRMYYQSVPSWKSEANFSSFKYATHFSNLENFTFSLSENYDDRKELNRFRLSRISSWCRISELFFNLYGEN